MEFEQSEKPFDDPLTERPTSFASNGQTLGTLFVEITQGISTLIRKEVELAKSELTEVVRSKLISAGMFVVGGILGILLIPFILLTVFEVLKIWLPGWGAALIVTGFTALLCGAVFAFALKMLRAKAKPEKTIESLKEDVAWIKRRKR